MRAMAAVWGVGLALLVAVPVSRAEKADDDLAVVKRATAEREQAAESRNADARPAQDDVRTEEKPSPREAPAHGAKEPQWLRIRIASKRDPGERVSINLPLALVRALGDDEDDLPIDLKRGARRVTLAEILRALDSGEGIVEIEDAEGSVRLWVE